jgi:hypothetical protein
VFERTLPCASLRNALAGGEAILSSSARTSRSEGRFLDGIREEEEPVSRAVEGEMKSTAGEEAAVPGPSQAVAVVVVT